ncbi:MAG: hypothetical protein ACOVNU_09190 [Candidatus Kapaibacteriota bacterium]
MYLNEINQVELFQTFVNVLKKYGVEGTLKILNKAENVRVEDNYVNTVLNIVADEFLIDLKDILYDKYKRGEQKYVVGFCIYYLYADYSMNDLKKLGVFKHKDFSVLSRYRQLIENLNPKLENDLMYIKIKNKLDIKIKEIKK